MADRPELLFLHPSGKVSRRLPLPLKTRLRLRATRRVDVADCWLVKHGQLTAASGCGAHAGCGEW